MSLHYTKSTVIQGLTSIAPTLNTELFTLSEKLLMKYLIKSLRSPCLLFSFCIHLIPFFPDGFINYAVLFSFLLCVFWEHAVEVRLQNWRSSPWFCSQSLFENSYMCTPFLSSQISHLQVEPSFMGQASVAARYWGIGNYAL